MRTAEQHFALREGHHNAAAVVSKIGENLTLNLIGTGPGVYLAGREQIEALQRACAFALATEPPAQKGAQR